MKEVSERGEGLENLTPQSLQELFGQWRKDPLDLAKNYILFCLSFPPNVAIKIFDHESTCMVNFYTS